MKEIPVLFQNAKDCCGCGSCRNICPVDAVAMQTGEDGFIYPVIDHGLCMRCGQCKAVCKFQGGVSGNTPIKCYAAVYNDSGAVHRSSSGGLSYALAYHTLKNGGLAYGAALSEELKCGHIAVEDAGQLHQLQSSKYVQSDMSLIYRDIKRNLENGREVFFCGTPCQVAGLRGYLQKCYTGLYLADLICHGVPSQKMFSEHIDELSRQTGGKIVSCSFRDKRKGWVGYTSVEYQKKGRIKTKYIVGKLSSYYSNFQAGNICRDACYVCPYASTNRQGDVTLGDYWGIRKEHPELLNTAEIQIDKGVSCVLVNTEKGERLLASIQEELFLLETSLEKIQAHNGQLQRPVTKPVERQQIMDVYTTQGYSAVEKHFRKKLGWKKRTYYLCRNMLRDIYRALKR